MLMRMSVASVVVGLMSLAATADEIQWKETQNIPKGLNFPEDVTGDILGIEIGDSYAEAKAKLEKLKAESPPDFGGKPDATIAESTEVIFLPLPGKGRIEAEMVGNIRLERAWLGKGQLRITENLTVWLSAPSSGHQVHGLERWLHYREQADQVSIPEMLAKLEQKFGATPVMKFQGSESVQYLWRFDDRKLQNGLNKELKRSCGFASGFTVQQNEVENLNPTGDCDAALEVQFTYGISENHAKGVRFQLFDIERIKSNLTADFAFFDTYVEELRTQASPAPKL
ncbi:MAG TPA: hypothetical protein PKY73_12775 [Hyphomonas sp.]|nr:hypothetical protein [Hyphomonas sp.]